MDSDNIIKKIGLNHSDPYLPMGFRRAFAAARAGHTAVSARLGDREADFEVAVIGGGVVGGILGAAGLRVALVESGEAPSLVTA